LQQFLAQVMVKRQTLALCSFRKQKNHFFSWVDPTKTQSTQIRREYSWIVIRDSWEKHNWLKLLIISINGMTNKKMGLEGMCHWVFFLKMAKWLCPWGWEQIPLRLTRVTKVRSGYFAGFYGGILRQKGSRSCFVLRTFLEILELLK
jgi:hypothetical protein